MNYSAFVKQKSDFAKNSGVDREIQNYSMFPHQVALTRWACRRGRAAIFADTGLGKTRVQLAWADTIGVDTLILAPLAVAEQTVDEGQSIGVSVTHARENRDIQPGINITNYDRIHKFDCQRFGAVVLDESSIIKHHDAKTLQILLDTFRNTPYKLACTATPAPNDWTELGNHAEFLGVRSRSEMLAEFFVHDGGETQTWRLKKHGREIFWRWVASWGALVRSPADLGYDASAYNLPPLNVFQHIVSVPHDQSDSLFPIEAQSLMERRQARRESIEFRARECARLVNESSDPWVVWCDLNAEGDMLTDLIDGAIQIAGTDSSDEKERRLRMFADGGCRVLISKPSICGFGLNWQHCAHMAFVGVTDSFEAYYQAVRRCWRFGQRRPVNVHIFASPREGSIIANLQRKEDDAKRMGAMLSVETGDAVRNSVMGFTKDTNSYVPQSAITVPTWLTEEEFAV